MKKLFHLFYLLPLTLCLHSTAYATASGAAVTATVENGAVTAITITSGGTGYNSAPDIFISLIQEAALARKQQQLFRDGVLTSVSVTAGGSGYTESSLKVYIPPERFEDIGDAS